MVFGTLIALLIQSGRGLVLLRFDSGPYKKETIKRIAFLRPYLFAGHVPRPETSL